MTEGDLSRVNVIVFDLDSTLLKLDVDWNALKLRLGDEFPSYRWESLGDLYNEVKVIGVANELSRLYRVVASFEQASWSRLRADVVMKELVIGSLSRFKLAVCSSNMRSTVNRALSDIGLSSRIEIVVSAEDVGRVKPSPEGLLKIAGHFRVRPEEVLFIGDLLSDAVAAEQSGVNFCYRSEVDQLFLDETD